MTEFRRHLSPLSERERGREEGEEREREKERERGREGGKREKD